MNAKAKGNRSEYKVRDHYEKQGAYVIRAGGSFGLWDLLAIHPDRSYLIQVKTNRNPSRAELEKLKAFQCHPSWSKVVAIVRNYQRTIQFFDL